MEDPSKKFIEFVDELEVPEASNTYNITGKSAAHVIAIFKSIVNNREGPYEYSKGKKFTFNIRNPPTISFELKAYPTKDQPGNGRIQRNNRDNALTYRELKKKLILGYKDDTETFAKDMKRVFKDNSNLFRCRNEVIQDVYILLLFEIGRRLVKDGSNATDRKKGLDSLPISGAITKIVNLFENEDCSFEDFFNIEGKFHCFTGELKKRKGAIRKLKLNEKFEDIKALFYIEEDKESFEDAASEGEESSEDVASENKESSEDVASESKESSEDAASEGKESSEDVASESKESSEDAASEGKESSEDVASESKESSEDAASEGKESSEDAEVRELSKDKGFTVQPALPWPPNKVSYLKTTFVRCKEKAYLPRRKFTIAGSLENPSQRFRGIEWPLGAFASMRAVCLFLRARAVVKLF